MAYEAAYPDFAPRFPWLGGDLQTLRYYLFPASEDLSAWPAERLSFPLPESGGDALLAVLHRPHRATDRPLVILVHGLTGCEGSSYMFEATRSFLTLGYPVMRLNLRGAGPSRETCRRSYCAGSGDNVEAVLSALEIEEARHGVVLIGFSLGGTVVLHYLARLACAVPPLCAVTVSTPLDLAAVIRRLMRPAMCSITRWLLARMKEAVIGGASEISPRQRAAVQDARSIYESTTLSLRLTTALRTPTTTTRAARSPDCWTASTPRCCFFTHGTIPGYPPRPTRTSPPTPRPTSP